MNFFTYRTSMVSFWKSVGYLVFLFVLTLLLSLGFLFIVDKGNMIAILTVSLLATVLAYLIMIGVDKKISDKNYKNLNEYLSKKSEAEEAGVDFVNVVKYEDMLTDNTYPYDNGYVKKDFTIGLSLLILTGGFSLSVILNYVFSLLDSFLPISEAELEFAELFESNLWFVVLMAVVVAPIFEEYIFRKILLMGYLRNGYTRNLSIVLSAVLFGIYHANIRQFLLATLLGIILGAVVYYTGRIMYSILLHFAFNLTSVVIGSLIPEGSLTFPVYMLLIALVVFAVVVFIVNKIKLFSLERVEHDI